MSAEPPTPPPPPPPPPPGYRTSYGGAAQAHPAPPPRPEINPALLSPSRAWYWVAGTIGVVAALAATALSYVNVFDNLGDEPGYSLLAWVVQIGGVGLAALIGGITWQRRTDHRRRLQNEEMTRQGLV